MKEGTPCKRGRSLIFNKLRRTIRSAFNYALKLTKNYLYLVYVSKLIGRYVIAFKLFTVKCEFLYAALYVSELSMLMLSFLPRKFFSILKPSHDAGIAGAISSPSRSGRIPQIPSTHPTITVDAVPVSQ